MKIDRKYVKITLGVFLFTTVIAFANSNDPVAEKKEKEEKEMIEAPSPRELNKDFISNVYDNSTQKDAQFLSSIIAEFDVKKSPQFEGRNKTFTTVFKSNKGMAEVTYNKDGRIVAVEKRLTNVMLPAQIQKIVFKRYGDWTIVQNKYNVSYKQGVDVDKYYIITVQKGNEKKIIRMNG